MVNKTKEPILNTSQIIGNAKTFIGDARSTASMVGLHGKDLARTGVQILHAAKDVIVEGGKEGVKLLGQTRDELQRTLSEGRDQIAYKLTHLNTPTHKEEAEARKAAIKEKKQRKRAEAA